MRQEEENKQRLQKLLDMTGDMSDKELELLCTILERSVLKVLLAPECS